MAGSSIRRICRLLYQEGIPSPTGSETWKIPTISQMLRNPTYKGKAFYNRHQAVPPTSGRKGTRNKLRPPEEWVEIPVPAIVSEELFEAAQRVSRDHSYFSPRRSRPDEWLLRRLVVCGHCGVKSHCQGTKSRDGTRELRYYVCNRRRSLEAGGPDRACPQPSIRAGELDSLVWQQVHAALVRPSLLVKGQSALEARAGRPDDELLKVQLKRLDHRLQQADVERRRVCDLYQMQAIELHEFQARHQEVVDRHQLLKQERDALVAQRQALAVNNRLARKVESFAERVREGIDSLDFDQRQKLLRLLVEQVRVTGPKVEIHLRIPLDEPQADGSARGSPADETADTARLSNQVRLRLLGRGLVQSAHQSRHPPRFLCWRRRARDRYPPLHRCPQCRSQAICLDGFCRVHSR